MRRSWRFSEQLMCGDGGSSRTSMHGMARTRANALRRELGEPSEKAVLRLRGVPGLEPFE